MEKTGVCNIAAVIINKLHRGHHPLSTLRMHLADCQLCDIKKAAEFLATSAFSKKLLIQSPIGLIMTQSLIMRAFKAHGLNIL